MPVYDCGDPECTECQREFRAKKISVVDSEREEFIKFWSVYAPHKTREDAEAAYDDQSPGAASRIWQARAALDGRAVSQLRDTAENVVIAYGMGWDMDSAIEVLRAALHMPQQPDLPQPMEWQSAVGDGRMNNDWQLYVDGSLRRWLENRFEILERRIAELEERG